MKTLKINQVQKKVRNISEKATRWDVYALVDNTERVWYIGQTTEGIKERFRKMKYTKVGETRNLRFSTTLQIRPVLLERVWDKKLADNYEQKLIKDIPGLCNRQHNDIDDYVQTRSELNQIRLSEAN